MQRRHLESPYRLFITTGYSEGLIDCPLFDGSRIHVGNGRHELFWLDNWTGLGVFKTKYSRLFAVSLCASKSVADCLTRVDTQPVWYCSWRRPLWDWEKGEVEELKLDVASCNLLPSREDTRRWCEDKNGVYSVSAGRDFIYKRRNLKRSTPYPWLALSPFNIECWIWLALHNGIPTRDALRYRGIIPLADSMCPLCLQCLETRDHLLISCPVAWQIWSKICRWLGVLWVAPASLQNFLLQWAYLMPHPISRSLWMMISYSALWSIWLERNRRVFENVAADCERIFDLILVHSTVWIKCLHPNFPFSASTVISNAETIINWKGRRRNLDCLAHG